LLRRRKLQSASIPSFLPKFPKGAVVNHGARRHAEYRGFLFDHLLNVTARHWDVSMRRLGAQSLRLICVADLRVLGPVVITRAVRRVPLLVD
jgi:hypothetical protein